MRRLGRDSRLKQELSSRRERRAWVEGREVGVMGSCCFPVLVGKTEIIWGDAARSERTQPALNVQGNFRAPLTP